MTLEKAEQSSAIPRSKDGTLEKEVICLNQIPEPGKRPMKKCQYCVADEISNSHCPDYTPVTLRLTHITVEGERRELYALDIYNGNSRL